MSSTAFRRRTASEEGVDELILCCVTTLRSKVSRTQLQSHCTHLPSTTLRRSVGVEGVPTISRACQSSSSLSPCFAPVKSLTFRKAWPRSTGRIRTPHPGGSTSSSCLAPSASQNCNHSTNPLPVSHVHCQFKRPERIERSSISRSSIGNGRAERT